MFTMDQVHTIRDLYFNQGLNLAEVAEKVGAEVKSLLPVPAASGRKSYMRIQFIRYGNKSFIFIFMQQSAPLPAGSSDRNHSADRSP